MKNTKWIACLFAISLLSGCAAGSVESNTQTGNQAAPATSAVSTTVSEPETSLQTEVQTEAQTQAQTENQLVSTAPVETIALADFDGEISLEDVLAWMEHDDAERAKLTGRWVEAYGGDTRIKDIKQVDDRYQAEVVRTVAVTASEEEMEQARQTGHIVLNGTQYRYTDSQEQFDEWMQELGLEGWTTESEDGIILEEKAGLSNDDLYHGSFYEVGKVGEKYIFANAVGGLCRRIQENAGEAWLWLDGDMPLDESPVWSEDHPEDGYTVASYLQNHSISDQICRFGYRDDEPCIVVDLR